MPPYGGRRPEKATAEQFDPLRCFVFWVSGQILLVEDHAAAAQPLLEGGDIQGEEVVRHGGGDAGRSAAADGYIVSLQGCLTFFVLWIKYHETQEK